MTITQNQGHPINTEILENAATTPMSSYKEEEDVLPEDLTQLNDLQCLPTKNPDNEIPIRRSSRIAKKPTEPQPTHTERAIQASREAGTRL